MLKLRAFCRNVIATPTLVLAIVCSLGSYSELDAGYLYVSNNSLDSINRYDSSTGQFVDRFISSGEGLESFEAPTALELGSDGNLYVMTQPSEIRRYNSQTGEFVDVFARAEENSSFGVMRFGSDGRLYVEASSGFSGFNGIVRFETDSGQREVFTDGYRPRGGMQFGADGDIFALGSLTITGDRRVIRIDGETGAVLGEFVTDPGFLTNTFADIDVGPDGNLYIAVSSGSADLRGVRRYDGATGEFIDKFADIDEADPYQLSFGPDGNLYVSIHTGDGKLKRYSGTTGEFIDNFVVSGPGNTDSWLAGPTGFVFSSTTAVPEPSTFVLSTMGVLAGLGLRRRSARRRRTAKFLPGDESPG